MNVVQAPFMSHAHCHKQHALGSTSLWVSSPSPSFDLFNATIFQSILLISRMAIEVFEIVIVGGQ